jgi:hypothetical protein
VKVGCPAHAASMKTQGHSTEPVIIAATLEIGLEA